MRKIAISSDLVLSAGRNSFLALDLLSLLLGTSEHRIRHFEATHFLRIAGENHFILRRDFQSVLTAVSLILNNLTDVVHLRRVMRIKIAHVLDQSLESVLRLVVVAGLPHERSILRLGL